MTGLAGLGIVLPVIERIVTHKGGTFAGVTGVYQHADFAKEQRAALDRWNCFLESHASGSID